MSVAPLMVSVIVPLFNGGPYIDETLRAILAQTHSTLEVLVVDDGSSDDGPELVRQMLDDPRLSFITKQSLGIAGTRNVGLGIADPRSEFVLFVDHDDVIEPHLVARLLELLTRRTEATAAYAIADFIDGRGDPLDPGGFAAFMRSRRTATRSGMRPVAPTADMTLPEIFLGNRVYPPSGVLMRMSAVRAIGGFDPAYLVADDWDALVKLARLGPLIPVDEVMLSYRRHGNNASMNTGLNVRETRAVWANTYYADANSPADRRRLRAAWRTFQTDTSRRKLTEARSAWRQGRRFGFFRLATDGLAHRVLFAPLRSWRLRPHEPRRTLAEYAALATREQRDAV
ncbi:glycosyltransferase family 2 protein [Agromyces sp. SYSU K20354]|uniref:glycosyltransferase family 2 protein n=1 Tax=Agromyces cavernae TaxID=2898659 RepID=UPI001E5F9399|nr:glycosyltransferase family A protein [Agromyces cavernae]MCD2441021.1 glycosyltransferase family 2 protein [Agromyces cavernae]